MDINKMNLMIDVLRACPEFMFYDMKNTIDNYSENELKCFLEEFM
jgi:hypothetical protein